MNGEDEPARLALRGLAVVAPRAQRPQPVPRIWIERTTNQQRAARLRAVVATVAA